jgi:hypothetical protein
MGSYWRIFRGRPNNDQGSISVHIVIVVNLTSALHARHARVLNIVEYFYESVELDIIICTTETIVMEQISS